MQSGPSPGRILTRARARMYDALSAARAGLKCVEALGRIIIRGPSLPTLKCYNLHALTVVIITKYIYIYFYTL